MTLFNWNIDTENDTSKHPKTCEPPNCDFLSSVLEPLDSFKYAEFNVKIKVDVKNHHTKVLS